MMQYKDLDLKRMREECGLDFAHFTYLRGMCSCCYGPAQFPAKYWRNNEVIPDDDPRYKDITYVIFKNANNGSGQVSANDTICETSKNQRKWGVYCNTLPVYIQWGMSNEQLWKVLYWLRRNLDKDYHVIRPTSESECIEIRLTRDMTKESWEREVRLDPDRPLEYVVKNLIDQSKVFTCSNPQTRDTYIVFAEGLDDAREKCEHLLKDGFELDTLKDTSHPGVYY